MLAFKNPEGYPYAGHVDVKRPTRGGVKPDDAEVRKAFADCALKQNRQRMRAALQKSDWQAALSCADQILALKLGGDEAQKAVKDCTLAVSRQAIH